MEGGDYRDMIRITAAKNVALDRREAEDAIDAAAAHVRARFAAPQKHQIYSDKRAEAIRYLDQVQSGNPVDLSGFPYLAAETGLTADTPIDLAELWLWMDSVWKGAAAAIEQIALSAKAEVRASRDRATIQAIVTATAETLDAIGEKPPERPKPILSGHPGRL
jgi:hypothetical protein